MAETIQTDRIAKSPSRTLLNLLGALVAGLVGFGFIHTQDPIYKVPEKFHIKNLGESQEKWSAFLEQQRRFDRRNAAVHFAVLGCALAVAIVLGNSACCSVPVRVLVAMPLGALAGALAGWIGCLAHETFVPVSVQPSVVEIVKVQIALFASLGFGLGLISGLFGRSWRSIVGGVVAGALGGLLAGMAFPLASSLLMPAASIDAFNAQYQPKKENTQKPRKAKKCQEKLTRNRL